MSDTPTQQQSAPELTNDLGQRLFPDTLVMVACNQCTAARPWPLNCGHDYAEIYTQGYTRVAADRVAPTVDQKELRESIEYVLWNWSHSTSDTVRELLNLFAKYLLTAFPTAPTMDHLLQDAGVILIEDDNNAGARAVIRFARLRNAQQLHSALLQARAAAAVAPQENKNDPLENETVDKELRRWQDAIRDKMIDLGAPDWMIDGAGCDSGDPLDFTLAEIGQGVEYFVDQLESGYWPVLHDRGDGVKGHFCVGRLIKLNEPYWEYWNKGQWTSAGEVFIGREAAQSTLDELRKTVAAATTPSTVPTYADGFCARCSELAYPLTRALESTGVPTGERDWQQNYGPNKVRAMDDHESCLRRLLLALEKGEPEEIDTRIQQASFSLEFHSAVRRKLNEQARQRDSSEVEDVVGPREDAEKGRCR